MERPSNPPLGIYDMFGYWYSVKYQDYHGNTSVWDWKESTSWIRVNDLYQYCTFLGAEVATYRDVDSLVENIQVGDIVQLKNAEGNWYHSIIITAKGENGFEYCGHVKDRIDEPISSIAGAERYRFIRF